MENKKEKQRRDIEREVRDRGMEGEKNERQEK